MGFRLVGLHAPIGVVYKWDWECCFDCQSKNKNYKEKNGRKQNVSLF